LRKRWRGPTCPFFLIGDLWGILTSFFLFFSPNFTSSTILYFRSTQVDPFEEFVISDVELLQIRFQRFGALHVSSKSSSMSLLSLLLWFVCLATESQLTEDKKMLECVALSQIPDFQSGFSSDSSFLGLSTRSTRPRVLGFS